MNQQCCGRVSINDDDSQNTIEISRTVKKTSERDKGMASYGVKTDTIHKSDNKNIQTNYIMIHTSKRRKKSQMFKGT